MLELIIDGQIATDSRATVASPEEGLSAGFSTLESLLAGESVPAVSITADDEYRQMTADQFAVLEAIEIRIADFNDGRFFTVARELRQAGFNGELRATGDYLLDQVQFMTRCGFNAFTPNDSASLEEILAFLAPISISYQQSLERCEPRYSLAR